MYCEVQGRTLVFHMQNGEQLESVGSMDDLSGQLAKYNNFLRAHRSYLVNMEYIKSRPHPGEKFQYYFYVEIEGSPMSEKGKLLLDEMQKLCRTVRLLGVYSREEPNG